VDTTESRINPVLLLKNDHEHILMLRKPGGYRTTPMIQKALSMLQRDEMDSWMRPVWSDIRGASLRAGHPAPFPPELAERLVRMFSFAGDMILDPLSGSGSTAVAAIRAGRNSISVEIEEEYLNSATRRAAAEAASRLIENHTALVVESTSIRMASPVIIQVAIELKSVLTEHSKARRNRLRDFGAFHGHGHTYDPRTVVAAFLVINSSDLFYSPPLNLGKTNRSELNTHASKRRSARQFVKESIDLFRTIHLRHSEMDGPGLEALGVIVIEHDNINFHPDPPKYAHLQRPTEVAPTPPNLPVGDPLSYDSMVQRICAHYTHRFAGRASG